MGVLVYLMCTQDILAYPQYTYTLMFSFVLALLISSIIHSRYTLTPLKSCLCSIMLITISCGNLSYDLDDKHVEIIKRLEVEKDALLVANGELLQSNLKLRSA